MELLINLLAIVAAIVAALASPLPQVLRVVPMKQRNPLYAAWEWCMMQFSSFGMTLLCGMVFLVLFAKMEGTVANLVIPVAIALLGLIDLSGDTFGTFSVMPPRAERVRWYRMTAEHHHPVALGALAAAGELFASGIPVLLLTTFLSQHTGTTVFANLWPLLWYALAFSFAIAVLTLWKTRSPHACKKWNIVLGIGIAVATVWMLLG